MLSALIGLRTVHLIRHIYRLRSYELRSHTLLGFWNAINIQMISACYRRGGGLKDKNLVLKDFRYSLVCF